MGSVRADLKQLVLICNNLLLIPKPGVRPDPAAQLRAIALRTPFYKAPPPHLLLLQNISIFFRWTGGSCRFINQLCCPEIYVFNNNWK